MSDLKSYQYPYYAQINFTIDMRKVLPDGSLDTSTISKKELTKYGISNNAVFGIQGFDKADCIQKLKQVLGGLKYE